MGTFSTWREWVKIREDNARKRAVRAALSGTGTPLPGSYAACPSTNPRAMKAAGKKGVVGRLPFSENDGQRPDYSFDNWVQMTKAFGSDVNKLRADAEGEDEDLDKKKKDLDAKADKEDAKAEPPEKSEPSDEDDAATKDKKEDVWTRLKKIHKDRLKAGGGSPAGSSPPPRSSSARSSRP
jgi:hypothetical protein